MFPLYNQVDSEANVRLAASTGVYIQVATASTTKRSSLQHSAALSLAAPAL